MNKYGGTEMRLILALVIILFTALPAFAADAISGAHLIKVRDTTYEAVEIENHFYDRNLLKRVIGYGGDKYYRIKLHGTDYPLTVKQTDVDSKELKEIPDNRGLERRHPRWYFGTRWGAQFGLTIMQWVIK